MKLNMDCVRDTMLYLETIPAYDKNGIPTHSYFRYQQLPDELISKYSNDDVLYSLEQIVKSGFVEGENRPDSGGSFIVIYSIDPLGHDFINNVRDKKAWNYAKEASKKVGSVSLNILSALASQFLAKQFGLL